MSDDVAPISREEEVLAVAMELELAVAKHVQAKLLAAEDADELNGLGRTWQRVSRSLRQTVALKAKLTREREAGPADARTREPRHHPHDDRILLLSPKTRARVEQAVVAARPCVERERPDWDEFDETELYDVLIYFAETCDDFLDAPMNVLVQRVLEEMRGRSHAFAQLRTPSDGAVPAKPAVDDSA